MAAGWSRRPPYDSRKCQDGYCALSDAACCVLCLSECGLLSDEVIRRVSITLQTAQFINYELKICLMEMGQFRKNFHFLRSHEVVLYYYYLFFLKRDKKVCQLLG